MAKALRTSQQRIDAMLRVVALVCIVIGGVFAYFISQTALIPQLVPIFYFMSALLIFAGAAVLIARFE
jgi:protein-S-isoprenylcysteine O-methyltransferase Ste14